VSATGWSRKRSESTRGRVLELLHQRVRTVEELATLVDLTDNAVRAHLVALERDGLVQHFGVRHTGARKPPNTYGLTIEAERLFSHAYIPLIGHLLDVLGERLAPEELAALLRAVGRRLARDRAAASPSPRERVEAAAALLNELGGTADVKAEDGGFVIRSETCLLGAVVQLHPEVCGAVEGIVSEVTGLPTRERCQRQNGRPRCSFQIAPSGSTTP
jgi:predicted ArsR family transcriptional regulator